MTDAKHTPGPWYVEHHVEIPFDPDMLVNGCTITTDNEHIAFGFGDGNGRANALLIAAAPDLLAACEAAIWEADNCDGRVSVDALRAAIRKAKGGE